MQNKNFLKMFISVGLIAALLLSACSNNGAGISPEASEDMPYAGETVTVLMTQQDSTEELRAELIPEFEDKTGIEVKVDILPESGMETKMTLSLSGNTGEYDVIMTGAKNWSQLVSSDWIKPLDQFLDDPDMTSKEYADGFSEQLLETLKYDGKVYAMPYQVGANMLFYNKKMFEEVGLDPEQPPNNMQELLEYAQKLHKPDEGQYGVVARGTREGNDNSFSWIMMWFLNGGRWEDADGNPKYDVLNEQVAVETTEYYKELMQYAPTGIGSYGFMEAQLAMQQGEAAMWLDAAQLGPSLEDEGTSKIAGDVGYHVMEGEGDDYVVGPVWGFSMTNTTQNEGAAWELIKYLTSKEVMLEQAISGTNGSPARSDVLQDEKINEVFNPDFAQALEKAINYANPLYTPLIAEGTEIRGALAVAISEVISGDKNPKEAMEEANSKVKGILENSANE